MTAPDASPRRPAAFQDILYRYPDDLVSVVRGLIHRDTSDRLRAPSHYSNCLSLFSRIGRRERSSMPCPTFRFRSRPRSARSDIFGCRTVS